MDISWLSVLLVLCVTQSGSAEDLCLVGDFDHQVNALLDYIRLPEEKYRTLAQVTSVIERLLQQQWPGAKITTYGSTVTRLAVKSSDIDCSVDVPGVDTDQRVLVNATLAILRKHSDLFKDFKTVLKTRVPLITCLHNPAQIFVDLTFSGSFSVESSLLLSHLLHMDQRGFDLATIIKYWGSVHNIANGKLTLPSYSIILMTVFYLQQKNIIPSVAALQEHVPPYIMSHWNTAYEPIQYHTDNNETLYELLGGFFKYYSDFDFENTVISPYTGHPIKRETFLNLDELENFSQYKENLAKGLIRPYKFGFLNVQDTLKHNENTARPYSGRWLVDKLIKHLRVAAMMYDVLGKEQFLPALLIPEKRIEAGNLKMYWPGGIASAGDCRRQISQNLSCSISSPHIENSVGSS